MKQFDQGDWTQRNVRALPLEWENDLKNKCILIDYTESRIGHYDKTVKQFNTCKIHDFFAIPSLNFVLYEFFCI